MSKPRLVIASIVFAGVCLSCTTIKNKLSGGKPVPEFTRVANLPPIDPKAQLPSPGAVVARRLAEIEPGVAALLKDVEASERGAMKQIIAAASVQGKTLDAKPAALQSSVVRRRAPAKLALADPVSIKRPSSALMMLQAGDTPLPGMGDGAMIGMLAGSFKSMLAGVDAGNFNRKNSRTETSEGTTTTMNVEFGGSEDGSTTFGMGLQTESTKNGVKVTTDLQAKIEGYDCPNAEGQVPLTVKMRLSARSGGSGYTQDITAFVRIVVGDDANIATTTIDLTQATSRGKGGQEVYVETGETIKYTGNFNDATQSNERVIQKTDNATDRDISEAWKSGQEMAYGAAIGAITLAESSWKGGKCIKIEANSPGTVEPSSTHEIPVKVRHRTDGSEVAAKLDATLSGESSVTPAVIPKTSGTLTYVAPGEFGKTATIKLKATSRRGIATLDLNAGTAGNAFRIAGGLDDWQTNTVVCDIMKPFTLTGNAFTVKFSGGLSGTYTYSGPFNAMGTGTYEISFPHGRDKNGHMTGRGGGSVQGDKTYTGTGTEEYTLYTVDGPCVDGPVDQQ